MSKLLEFLVPHYNEGDECVAQFLTSIAFQQNVDFSQIGVTIINDGPDHPLTLDLDIWPFDVNYIVNDEHKGVSAVRNQLMDTADSEYICFCDSDDMFVDLLGLQTVINEMVNNPFEVMRAVFKEEGRDEDGNAVFADRDDELIFVHSKFFNLEWLRKENIRFEENLTIHEDSFFVHQAMSISENQRHLHTPIYLWKWRDNSIARRDVTNYAMSTFEHYVDSNVAINNEFIKRGMNKEFAVSMCSFIFNAYYELNSGVWALEENEGRRKKAEYVMQSYLYAYGRMFDAVPDDVKNEIYKQITQRNLEKNVFALPITFSNWVSYIINLA